MFAKNAPVTTHRRFDRAARLLGDAGVARLQSSTVTVFGVGGVGSFAAEALVRSGVGRVILVDYDRICVTNVNRQLHAMKGTLGKSKVAVMAERLRLINPDAVIEPRAEFYGPETSARLLTPEPDVVIDAIDNMAAKMHLIATCLREKIRIVSAMGAAARRTCVGSCRRWAPRRGSIPRRCGSRISPRRASIRSRARCGITCAASTTSISRSRSASTRCTRKSRRSRHTCSRTMTARFAACVPAVRTA